MDQLINGHYLSINHLNMKIIERTSHYITQPLSQIQKQQIIRNEICNRVKENLKCKSQKQTYKKHLPSRTRKLKVPKANQKYHVEAFYAAIPVTRKSSIIKRELDENAQEFKKVIRMSQEKKKKEERKEKAYQLPVFNFGFQLPILEQLNHIDSQL